MIIVVICKQIVVTNVLGLIGRGILGRMELVAPVQNCGLEKV